MFHIAHFYKCQHVLSQRRKINIVSENVTKSKFLKLSNLLQSLTIKKSKIDTTPPPVLRGCLFIYLFIWNTGFGFSVKKKKEIWKQSFFKHAEGYVNYKKIQHRLKKAPIETNAIGYAFRVCW